MINFKRSDKNINLIINNPCIILGSSWREEENMQQKSSKKWIILIG